METKVKYKPWKIRQSQNEILGGTTGGMRFDNIVAEIFKLFSVTM
jgi:hypothetical protein